MGNSPPLLSRRASWSSRVSRPQRSRALEWPEAKAKLHGTVRDGEIVELGEAD